jgi:hypothetical protein
VRGMQKLMYSKDVKVHVRRSGITFQGACAKRLGASISGATDACPGSFIERRKLAISRYSS